MLLLSYIRTSIVLFVMAIFMHEFNDNNTNNTKATHMQYEYTPITTRQIFNVFFPKVITISRQKIRGPLIFSDTSWTLRDHVDNDETPRIFPTSPNFLITMLPERPKFEFFC